MTENTGSAVFSPGLDFYPCADIIIYNVKKINTYQEKNNISVEQDVLVKIFPGG